MQAHFVRGSVQGVDANYVFSLMKPNFSLDGSSRKDIEESVLDSFQDFFISLEDHEKVSGYAEAVSWNYEDGDGVSEISSPDRTPTEEFQTADITVAGVLSWLTGQSHQPMNGDPLTIYVNFDHECLMRNPKHTICFPFCFSDEGSCMATNQLEKGQLRSQLYKRSLEVSYSHFNYIVVVM